MNGRAPAILDHLAVAGRHDAQPDAAAARPARADGVRAVRHPAAAAVDRQPPPQGAGRQRLGRVARRRHQPPLHDDARRPRRRRRGGCGCWSASRSGRRRPRRRISGGCRRRSPSGAPSRRSSSPRRPASGIALRDELFGDRFHLAALAALRRRRLDGRRSRLRHRPGERGARAVRRARDRGRRLGGDAAGGEASGCTASTTSTCAAASSKRCRSTMRGSTRRR